MPGLHETGSWIAFIRRTFMARRHMFALLIPQKSHLVFGTGVVHAIMKLGGNIRNERTIFEVVWLGGGEDLWG